ncbi:hypothetical protein AB0D59_15570 [Streptomyces sp. NPDC048417]|uniref:hypothetical protein n=1 Tax=Streptomyces sp. NPDC048417 TaxID=3155387 RepID=UPI0034316786
MKWPAQIHADQEEFPVPLTPDDAIAHSPFSAARSKVMRFDGVAEQALGIRP